MFRKKKPPLRDPSEILPAIVRPNAGVSDAQLMEWLTDHGAFQVTQLADGFLSVRASRETLDEAEAIAQVEIKTKSELH